MRVLIASLWFLVTIAANRASDDQWINFKKTYNKTYTNETEDSKRRKIFEESLAIIENCNSLNAKNNISYNCKLSKYADWDGTELTGLNSLRPLTTTIHAGFTEHIDMCTINKLLSGRRVRPYVNWEEEGALNPIQDQGDCASSYAFAVAAAIEAHSYIMNGKVVKVSEQQIIDCSIKFGNSGCTGGYMTASYDYFTLKGHKAMFAKDYPYEQAINGCEYDKSKGKIKLIGYRSLPPGDEKLMKEAVCLTGPIVVGINAASKIFKFYSDGIYDDPDCNSSVNNHAVLIVGYGRANGTEYWIIRNSMGKDWGNDGLARIPRGINFCGIANMPTYPLVKKSK